MVSPMIVRFIVAVLFGFAATVLDARAQTEGQRAQVVVELFTSQGCTQCPRANRLISLYSHEPGVLALTLPVGIWDYLGWRDTFAQPSFTSRQRAYSETLHVRGRFTPQLVINGAAQVSAFNWDDARSTFNAQRTSGWPANAPTATITRLRDGHIRVTIGAGAAGSAADVWLVSYEPGPINVVISGGLNINRTIAHYNLVNDIDRVGGWDGAPVWYERSRCQPNCAVIVQEPEGGRILAAAYITRRR